MKTLLTTTFVIALIVLGSAPSTSFALTVDTVIVAALPPGNLNNVINADTNASGIVKPNTVFLLKPTGSLDTVYWMTAPISSKGSITIIGTINPTTGHPPVVAPSIAEDNSSIGNFFSPEGNDTLTLKGLYFMGTRTDTVSFTGRFVAPAGDYNVFVFDHCVLENISGGGTPNLFDTWDHDHNSFYVTNCEFRNNQDDNPQNPGFAWVDPGTYPCDTAIFRNNTFFITGGYVLGSSGYGCSYLDFEHNTIFMSGEGGVFDLYQMTNSIIRNNIFFGVSSAAYPAAWYNNIPGSWGSSLIPIDSLRSLATAPYNLTEAGRHITITNNAYFWPQAIVNNWIQYKGGTWASDSIHWPTLIDAQPGMLTNKTAWPNINVANNDSLDPGFNSTLVQSAAGKMVTFVDTCWNNSGSGQGIRPYLYSLYDPPTWVGVSSSWRTVKGNTYYGYPVAENLRYSNTAMQSMGSDGKALGDLNWFPEQITAVSQKPTSTVPQQFTLSQNYPNPFNPTTTIAYSISQNSFVTLKVYNVLGQEVASLVNQQQNASSYTVDFDASRLSSGIYFYKIQAGSFTMTKKMLLLK
ncbi:MAG TPA: T9SS type A sorting domain-containing protein [Bacteroidota bacterium]|nr:T9SS type A sorting domain-containing protein [Bacteroidota bacterium]